MCVTVEVGVCLVRVDGVGACVMVGVDSVYWWWCVVFYVCVMVWSECVVWVGGMNLCVCVVGGV